MNYHFFAPRRYSRYLPRTQKIRDRQLAAPLESETLQELVVNELKTKKHVATEGLIWLVRCVPSPPPLQPLNQPD